MALRPALLAVLVAAALAPASAAASCDLSGTFAPWPSCPGHIGGSGAQADRIPILHLGVTPEYAGYRASHRSICSSVADWQVGHHLVQGDALPPARYFYTWSHSGQGVLVCGPHVEVHGHSGGPGGAMGESLRCPDLPSLGNRTRPVDVGWWVSDARSYAQLHGSFGHNHDGFWHYRLHNPGAGTVTVQLYGFCRVVV
jgi:hypothetical protein